MKRFFKLSAFVGIALTFSFQNVSAAASGAGGDEPAGAVRGPLSHGRLPEIPIEKTWFGVGGSHLYRTGGQPRLPAVPLLHEYHPTFSGQFFAGKFAPGSVNVPRSVASVQGELQNVYLVVMPTPWAGETLVRPHHAHHTRDNQETTVTSSIKDSDFGGIRITDKITVKMHTHPSGAGYILASPNAGKIDFGMQPQEIGSGSFWIVGQYGGKKIATLYWLINNPTLVAKITPVMAGAPTLQALMASLDRELPGDPQVKKIRELLKYELTAEEIAAAEAARIEAERRAAEVAAEAARIEAARLEAERPAREFREAEDELASLQAELEAAMNAGRDVTALLGRAEAATRVVEEKRAIITAAADRAAAAEEARRAEEEARRAAAAAAAEEARREEEARRAAALAADALAGATATERAAIKQIADAIKVDASKKPGVLALYRAVAGKKATQRRKAVRDFLKR